jgi:hypothetical protein
MGQKKQRTVKNKEVAGFDPFSYHAHVNPPGVKMLLENHMVRDN